jgi:hypothetical protein
MGVKTLKQVPAAARSRRTTPPLNEKDLKAAVDALEAGQFPGPDQTFESMKAARRTISTWYKQVNETASFRVGTKVWEGDDGKWYAVLRTRPDAE